MQLCDKVLRHQNGYHFTVRTTEILIIQSSVAVVEHDVHYAMRHESYLGKCEWLLVFFLLSGRLVGAMCIRWCTCETSCDKQMITSPTQTGDL